jgi:hypothetical protein
MSKCSPAAARILSMYERAEAGNDIAGNEVAEFFLALVQRRLPSNLAALYREAQYDRWLWDIAGSLGPRPGARAAHQKLKRYAGTSYPRDRDIGTVSAGENGTLFLMLESRGGDFLSEARILKRLRNSRGQKRPLS